MFGEGAIIFNPQLAPEPEPVPVPKQDLEPENDTENKLAYAERDQKILVYMLRFELIANKLRI